MATYSTYYYLLNEEKYNEIFGLFENETFDKLVSLLGDRKFLRPVKVKNAKSSIKLPDNKIIARFWKEFWQNYILGSRHASSFINEQYTLLGEYFTNISQPDPDFLESIATNYPIATINAIRISRKFTDKNFLVALHCLEKSNISYLQKHYAVFRKLQFKENRLWENAVESVQHSRLKNIQWLYILFLHYQWHIHQDKKKQSFILNHYIDNFIYFQAYSVFVSYLLSHQKEIDGTEMNDISVIRSIRELLEDPSELKEAVDSLQLWVDWYSFVYLELEQYCFNLNYEVKEINDDEIILYPRDVYMQSLKYASVIRQSMFFARIRNYAHHISSKIMADLLKVKEKKQLSMLEVFEEFIKHGPKLINYSESSVLSSVFCLDPNETKSLNKLLLVLSTLKAEAQLKYLIPFTAIQPEDFDSWLATIHDIIKKNIDFNKGDSNPLPFFLLSEYKFKNNLDAGIFEKATTSDIISLFVYDTGKPHRPFNRFNPFFNFYETPLLQFGTVITGIKTLLGAQDSGVLALETYMNQGKMRAAVQMEESKQLEKELAEWFGETGFHSVFLNIGIASEDRSHTGEIDLLIIEGNECLLVEVKRSRLPLTPFELFQDEETTLKKAADQLNKNIGMLKSGKPYNLSVSDSSGKASEKKPVLTKGINYHGCIISMYCNKDAVSYGGRIYKTSYTELVLGEIMKYCKDAAGNKIKALLERISSPYIPDEFLKNPKMCFDIKL